MTIAGRHVFDLTDGWDGEPPAGSPRDRRDPPPAAEGWDTKEPFHFVDGVEAAVANAQELAGDRMVEVAAGDVGGQALAAGLVDEVRMDVVPVVFGSGKRYFGSVDAHTRWRSLTWLFRASGCFTCAIGCAVDRSERDALLKTADPIVETFEFRH